MWTAAKAVVPSPSYELLTAVRQKSTARLSDYQPKLTRQRHVVFNLRLDAELSARLNPDGWRADSDKYTPRLNAPLTVYVYDMPKALEGEKVGWRVEARETSLRRPRLESCTIVADGNGLPLVPYYRADNWVDYTRIHSTDLSFSAATLGLLEWESMRLMDDTTVGTLSLKLVAIDLEDGRPVVRDRTVFYEERSELAHLDSLTPEMSPTLPVQWHEALRGLRERMECERYGCRGHYYSDAPE